MAPPNLLDAPPLGPPAAGAADLGARSQPMTAAAGPAHAVATEPAGLGPRHILIYTDDAQHGGVAQYNHAIALGLLQAGFRVSMVQSASDSPLVAQQRAAGVRHLWLDYDTAREFPRTIHDTASAQRMLRAGKPDLVVFSDCCPCSNFAARAVAAQLGLPYVVVVGFVAAYLAQDFGALLPMLARQYAGAAGVVAVSQENLDLLRNAFGLAPQAGQVIHYGRPERFFAPPDPSVRARLRGELGLPPDAVVSFTAARLAPIKGYAYQVAAARELRNRPEGQRLHFVWAGGGAYAEELTRAIAAARLGDRIHLLGHRWDVADWYDAADVFLLTSEQEGMPLAIMEAMAKGLPVAATAVSGIPEELGDTGQLLPPGAADRAGLISQLVRTLGAWTTDAALRHRVGVAGKRRAEALFREATMVARTLELVRSCVPTTPPANRPAA